ncbi:MAG: thiamine phosphate synthase [Smithella sp.]|nr:thiamine phosphate synthase [Smithella sp.]
MLRPSLRRGLYLVLTEPRDGYETLCRWAVKACLPAVQLRYKGHNEREHLALAHALRRITNGTGTLFIVNDRPDIALISRADGVHLGQDDLVAAEARQLIGPAMLLGLSTHNLEQVVSANAAPVDYIGFGPLFTTDSKERPDPVTGPDVLNAALTISRHPVVAIGGLGLERIKQLHAHPNNAAVIRAVSDAPDPPAAMRAIHEACLEMDA